MKDISVTSGLGKNVYSAVGWYSKNVSQILLVNGLAEFFYIFASCLVVVSVGERERGVEVIIVDFSFVFYWVLLHLFCNSVV